MMTNFSTAREGIIGIDVASATVAIYDQTTNTHASVANQLDVLVDALAPLRDRALAVCEATGGYEDKLLIALERLGIPVHRADGRRLNAYARSIGPAKTDRIDAQMLARYGRERFDRLAHHSPTGEAQAELVALIRRRIELVEIRKIERTRAKAPRAHLVADSIASLLAVLDQQIESIDTHIRALFARTAKLEQRCRMLQTIPGVGQQTAITLLALMPELGILTRRSAASLAAVAPHPRDSGTSNAPRRTTGGRRCLRPILFIAALSAIRGSNTLATFYRRLLDNGKAKKTAIVAVMRKIVIIANARLQQLT